MIAKAFKKLSGSRGAVVRDYLSLFSGSAGRLVVSLLYFIALANTLPTGDFGIFATAHCGHCRSASVALDGDDHHRQ